MVEFKAKADKIIKERYGIEVEHLCAVRNGEKLTYEKLFYHVPKRKDKSAERFGGGVQRVPCTDRSLVQQQTQNPSLAVSPTRWGAGARNSKTGAIKGFPYTTTVGWCKDLKRRVFPKLPCTRSQDKYCAVPRYCRR